MYCFHNLARRVNWIEKWFNFIPLNMKEADSSKTLVAIYKITQCYTPEDHNLSIHQNENLVYQI